jgi:Spy/CpxP family protein refolding chaperone
MNKLLATLIAGTFAVVSTAAMAQGAATAPGAAGMAKEEKKDPKGSGAAYANPAAEQTAADKAKEGKMNVDKSKMQSKTKTKYDQKSAEGLSDNSTNEAQAKANVDASKAMSAKRVKMPNVKDMTPEQRKELMRQLQQLSTP